MLSLELNALRYFKTLDVYSHVVDEFDIAERVSPRIRSRRRAAIVSERCPPDADEDGEEQETPANLYNPIVLPTISLMRSGLKKGDHGRPSQDEDSLQISLFSKEERDGP